MLVCAVFFFFKQKTAYEMRISDWSSDVCSSDLIETHFAVGPGAVQATLAVFFIGLAVGQAIYGPIADRFGRRRPLLVGIAVYVVASALAAHASTIELLTLARLMQALGGCAGIVIARAPVRDQIGRAHV